MKAIRWLLKLMLVMITLPLLLAVWLAKWFVVFLHHCSAWFFLSAGQCAIGNGDSFVPHASVARNGSTSNADRWICDFYDTAGGRRRGSTSGTGGSNASAGMVHIRCQTRIARLWNCLNKSNALIVERISIFSTMRVFHSAGM